ncbi:hypothetical protein B7463_g1876, partial [Scytalidium lignicola]
MLTPREVLQIAIEADKYSFGVALKYASIQWLQPRGNTDKVDMGYLMAAAFLFGDMEMFVAHTLQLIIHYKGSYLELLEHTIISKFLPSNIFCLLEERRSRMRAELAQLLINGMNASCSCGWGAKRSDRYKNLHSMFKPLRMLEVPISEFIKEMEAVPCEELEQKLHSPGFGSYYHELPMHSETFAGKLEIIKKKYN